ncbi:MAG TPA: hypothetical protein VLZ89_00010 [Anaerolineales bacterium]|nr:hypothetical protein [Anaerolineales bacterium]
MSNFDYNEHPTPPKGGRGFNPLDLMSIVVLLVTVCIGGYFALVFINPNIPLNPFPPPPTPFSLPTATITPIQLPATWTPTNPPFMTATDTPPPTFTLIPTVTPFSLVPPTHTPLPTATPKAPFTATVTYISSTIIYPDLDCHWLGIGGTIVDSNGADLIPMIIGLAGTLNGQQVPLGAATASGAYPAYGRSGFEFNLGTILHLSTVPLASTGTLYLHVLDQAGLPLSDNIYINTYTDCSKNLVLVRFKKRP